MAYTYDSYVAALRVMIASTGIDAPFDTILSSIIDYAEQRIYRELNLISTVTTDTSTTLTIGDRNATIPSTFITVTNVSLLTPAASNGATGYRVPLTFVSRDTIDMMWPGPLPVDTPQMVAMVDQWSLIVGPVPDQAYTLEVVGTLRPEPLSASNPNTFLTEHLPDLFMAASMIFASSYQRNFGSVANDPAMAMTWEAQYQLLKGSADGEELRKRMWSSSWSSQPTSAAAVPSRG